MKHIFFTLSILFSAFVAIAQPPNIQWAKCYGGSKQDIAKCVRQTTDGGYIIVGNTTSSDSEVSVHHGTFQPDIWVVKTDNTGAISWTKVFGGSGSDNATCVRQTKDGGYIVVGGTNSTDGDITGVHSGAGGDMLVLKLDASGNISWQKCLGGSGNEYAWAVRQTKDDGYVVTGFTASNDGDVSGTHNDSTGVLSQDVWVVKLNDTGGITWQKPLGGTGVETGYAVQQTTDGGYMVAGITNSDDGDVTKRYGNSNDAWLIKLDNTGSLNWQKSLGGTGVDGFTAVTQTTDGGYIACGLTLSNDNDVAGNHLDSTSTPTSDVWVVKTDNAGSISWQRCYGGSGSDEGSDVQQTTDGGYVVAATAASNDGNVKGIHIISGAVEDDFWVLQLFSGGDISWQKCLGGSYNDHANSIQQTADDGYVVAGYTSSVSGDVSHNNGQEDFWAVKLDKPAAVNNVNATTHLICICPNPSQSNFTVQYHLSADAALEVADVAGRVITTIPLHKGTTQTTINAAAWQPGMYFYKVMQNDSMLESGKLVKE